MSDCLRPVLEADLDRLLEWRNSEQVRNFMYSSHLIGRDEHLRWFALIEGDASRHPLIFMQENNPAGFVNIGPVKSGGIADWGFYAAPGAVKGTGRRMGLCALEYAFRSLKLHKLCGEALAHNDASRRFHLHLGFRQEGELVDQYFDGSRYHEVIRFGLISKEWARLKQATDTRGQDEFNS